MPTALRHVMIALTSKCSPASPELSPLRGDLKDLAPILLQVSLTEMLLDDSARYFHRAKSQGGDVVLHTYDNMVHVWHMFYPELSEAKLALEGVADFLRAVEEGGARAA
jgi:acetyl esterase/lipase